MGIDAGRWIDMGRMGCGSSLLVSSVWEARLLLAVFEDRTRYWKFEKEEKV